MDEISQEEFDKASAIEPEKIEKQEPDMTDEEFQKLLDSMNNPVDAQRSLAVQIKLFLDKRIEKEKNSERGLSDGTRRWVESYLKILEKIQSALHGDKSVNLHLHKVSHSDISSKIRESIFDIKEKKKKKKVMA